MDNINACTTAKPTLPTASYRYTNAKPTQVSVVFR